jgi:Zn-dependent peptidase ImmA (M78 family)
MIGLPMNMDYGEKQRMISSIRICGVNYQIVFKSNEEMNGLIGYANFNAQEIGISADHTPQTQRIALLHEIIHILSDVYNLKMDEDDVRVTTHAFLSLFSDNPDLIPSLFN